LRRASKTWVNQTLPIAHGDSGSWVIQDGRLCGYIVAGRDSLPWAYMVLIEDVFENITSYLDESSRIYLPSKAYIDNMRAGPIHKMNAVDLAKGLVISVGGLLSTMSMQLADVGQGPEQPERMEVTQSRAVTNSLVKKVEPYVTFGDAWIAQTNE